MICSPPLELGSIFWAINCWMAHVSQFQETWAMIYNRQAGFVLEDNDEKNGEPKYDG